MDEERTVEESSASDVPMDYSELLEEDGVFLGETPFHTILDGIDKQMNNYIRTEDRTDYVDLFYGQLHASYQAIKEDIEEEHPVEKREVLDKLHQEFIDFMAEKIKQRLTITFRTLESEEYDENELEEAFRLVYETFILHAPETITKVVVASALLQLKDVSLDADDYMDRVHTFLEGFSPLIMAVKPEIFLELAKADAVTALYQSGVIVGNFLRRYSPRLYANEDFEIDLINNITMALDAAQVIRKSAASEETT